MNKKTITKDKENNIFKNYSIKSKKNAINTFKMLKKQPNNLFNNNITYSNYINVLLRLYDNQFKNLDDKIGCEIFIILTNTFWEKWEIKMFLIKMDFLFYIF